MKTIKTFNKIHSIIFLLLVVTTILNAQTGYQSFFGDSTTTYHVFTSMTSYTHDPGLLGCGSTFQYKISKQDTIMVHDTVYFKPHDLYIREDTTYGRIYRYFPDMKKEFLTCDMSLNVGDTFQLPVFSDDYFYDFFYEEAGFKLVVDSIAYINGKKVIYFPFINVYDELSHLIYSSHYFSGAWYKKYNIIPAFIEGIGPTFSPFVFACYSMERDMSVLLCVNKNDTLNFMLNEQLGCYQSAAKITEIENAKIQILPNPANDCITLTFENMDNITGKIVIIDMIGNVVYRNTIVNNSTQVNVSSFSQGIYTAVFTNKTGKLVSKFIKIN
ncbi:MAG: T9SS type A sorting domain-containing protein [Bacteroidales bacterium]|nr:T9SS type A sorting domain-containing protein [Bacteroidales bacterium]